jgi:hypothetical protein
MLTPLIMHDQGCIACLVHSIRRNKNNLSQDHSAWNKDVTVAARMMKVNLVLLWMLIGGVYYNMIDWSVVYCMDIANAEL